MWPFKKREQQAPDRDSIEQKLAFLAENGFQLEQPFSIDDLMKNWSAERPDAPGFEAILVALGDFEGSPPWRPFCRNLWHFDTECIEDSGAYAEIARRMMTMTEGSLQLENIRDHVDVEGRNAWLEFECQSERFHIDCRVKDDWVDPSVFGPLIDLLESADPNKLFLYYGLFGQDCLLACTTTDQYEALRFAGINFEPLKAEKLR